MAAHFIPIGEPAHDAERQGLRFLVEGLPADYTVYRTQRVAADKGAATFVDTELGAVAVNLAESLLTLASELREARTTDAAFAVVQRADKELDQWQRSRPREAERYGTISLPFGVELQVPDSFEPRK